MKNLLEGLLNKEVPIHDTSLSLNAGRRMGSAPLRTHLWVGASVLTVGAAVAITHDVWQRRKERLKTEGQVSLPPKKGV